MRYALVSYDTRSERTRRYGQQKYSDSEATWYEAFTPAPLQAKARAHTSLVDSHRFVHLENEFARPTTRFGPERCVMKMLEGI